MPYSSGGSGRSAPAMSSSNTGRARTVLLGIAAASVAGGCGAEGEVRLEMAHQTVMTRQSHVGAPEGATAIAPTDFGLKMLSAYLAEDVDPDSQNNVGAVARVWVNRDCPSDDGCTDADVGFSDLIDPTALNQTLAGEARPVAVGSYRYIRFDFCIGGATGANVRFATAGTAKPVELTYGGCGVTSLRAEPAIEVVEGSLVRVALDYDLDGGTLYAFDAGSCTVDAPCLSSLDLTPRVVIAP